MRVLELPMIIYSFDFGLIHIGAESFILLLKNQHIIRCIRPHGMPEYGLAPQGNIIFLGIKQGFIVIGPGGTIRW